MNYKNLAISYYCLNIFDFPKQQRSCPEGAERVDYLVSPSLKRKNLKMQKTQQMFHIKHCNRLPSAPTLHHREARAAEHQLKANRNTGNKFLVSTYYKIMCNQEVSCFSRAKQRQRNVQKSVLHVQICFFANQCRRCKFVFFADQIY